MSFEEKVRFAHAQRMTVTTGEEWPSVILVDASPKNIQFFCISCNEKIPEEKLQRHLIESKHERGVKGKLTPESHVKRVAAGVANGPLKLTRSAVLKPFQFCNEPLIGLECVAEVWGCLSQDPKYHCLLCDEILICTTIVPHLTSVSHQISYLERYYPRALSALQKMPQNIADVVKKIVGSFGRMRPIVVSEPTMVWRKEEIMRAIVKELPTAPSAPQEELKKMPDTDKIETAVPTYTKTSIEDTTKDLASPESSSRLGDNHIPFLQEDAEESTLAAMNKRRRPLSPSPRKCSDGLPKRMRTAVSPVITPGCDNVILYKKTSIEDTTKDLASSSSRLGDNHIPFLQEDAEESTLAATHKRRRPVSPFTLMNVEDGAPKRMRAVPPTVEEVPARLEDVATKVKVLRHSPGATRNAEAIQPPFLGEVAADLSRSPPDATIEAQFNCPPPEFTRPPSMCPPPMCFPPMRPPPMRPPPMCPPTMCLPPMRPPPMCPPPMCPPHMRPPPMWPPPMRSPPMWPPPMRPPQMCPPPMCPTAMCPPPMRPPTMCPPPMCPPAMCPPPMRPPIARVAPQCSRPPSPVPKLSTYTNDGMVLDAEEETKPSAGVSTEFKYGPLLKITSVRKEASGEPIPTVTPYDRQRPRLRNVAADAPAVVQANLRVVECLPSQNTEMSSEQNVLDKCLRILRQLDLKKLTACVQPQPKDNIVKLEVTKPPPIVPASICLPPPVMPNTERKSEQPTSLHKDLQGLQHQELTALLCSSLRDEIVHKKTEPTEKVEPSVKNELAESMKSDSVQKILQRLLMVGTRSLKKSSLNDSSRKRSRSPRKHSLRSSSRSPKRSALNDSKRARSRSPRKYSLRSSSRSPKRSALHDSSRKRSRSPRKHSLRSSSRSPKRSALNDSSRKRFRSPKKDALRSSSRSPKRSALNDSSRARSRSPRKSMRSSSRSPKRSSWRYKNKSRSRSPRKASERSPRNRNSRKESDRYSSSFRSANQSSLRSSRNSPRKARSRSPKTSRHSRSVSPSKPGTRSPIKPSPPPSPRRSPQHSTGKPRHVSPQKERSRSPRKLSRRSRSASPQKTRSRSPGRSQRKSRSSSPKRCPQRAGARRRSSSPKKSYRRSSKKSGSRSHTPKESPEHSPISALSAITDNYQSSSESSDSSSSRSSSPSSRKARSRSSVKSSKKKAKKSERSSSRKSRSPAKRKARSGSLVKSSRSKLRSRSPKKSRKSRSTTRSRPSKKECSSKKSPKKKKVDEKKSSKLSPKKLKKSKEKVSKQNVKKRSPSHEKVAHKDAPVAASSNTLPVKEPDAINARVSPDKKHQELETKLDVGVMGTPTPTVLGMVEDHKGNNFAEVPPVRDMKNEDQFQVANSDTAENPVNPPEERNEVPVSPDLKKNETLVQDPKPNCDNTTTKVPLIPSNNEDKSMLKSNCRDIVKDISSEKEIEAMVQVLQSNVEVTKVPQIPSEKSSAKEAQSLPANEIEAILRVLEEPENEDAEKCGAQETADSEGLTMLTEEDMDVLLGLIAEPEQTSSPSQPQETTVNSEFDQLDDNDLESLFRNFLTLTDVEKLYLMVYLKKLEVTNPVKAGKYKQLIC